MNKQELMQLKIISLQQAVGDLERALPIFDWLRERVDENGTKIVEDEVKTEADPIA